MIYSEENKEEQSMILMVLTVIIMMRYSHRQIEKGQIALRATTHYCDAGDRLMHYRVEYRGSGPLKRDPTYKRLLREMRENQIFFWEHHLYCVHEKELAAFLKHIKRDKELYQRTLKLSFAKFGKAFSFSSQHWTMLESVCNNNHSPLRCNGCK
jgi:hypothetical protein